jgi:hypothetical protein
MPISQAGALNTAALTVPGAYISIVPPAPTFLNGVPSNIEGIVGTASWGPENSPTFVGNPQQYQAIFGNLQNRLFDMGTALNLSVQQGASNFACVRVTDGTDTAASVLIQANCLTLTSIYSGSNGNNTVGIVGPGSQSGTFQVTVSIPGLAPENYNNIGAGLAGNALWLAIAAAINNGNTALRGPSQIVVATAGAGSTAPASASYNLAGGTDGANGITTSMMVGSNATPRTGMFALQNTGASVAMLADLTDFTSFPTQIAFGLANGMQMVAASVSGDNIAACAAAKAAGGVDSYAFKLILGDWVYWLDTVNNLTRLVSPQAAYCGLKVNQSPQNSPLNKRLQGVVGTQKSISKQVYSQADIQQLVAAGIDVIANPSPGGAYFSFQTGHNTSSNPLIHGDAYTSMINFIAATLNLGMGPFVGLLDDPDVQKNALASISSFLDNLAEQKIIGNAKGTTPYSVQIDPKNNPDSQLALGYLQITVQVQFLAVIEILLINVQGGSSVQIQSIATLPQAA